MGAIFTIYLPVHLDDRIFNAIIHDNTAKKIPTLHNRFNCSVDPTIWREAINTIKQNELNKRP